MPLIGLALALAGCGHKATTPDDDTAKADTATVPIVQAATVTVRPIDDILPATGTVTAMLNREATVIPAVSGQIDSLPVRVGQQVDKGQIVAHLSTRTLNGSIQQAEATVRQNDVQIRQAQVGVIQQQAQTRASVLQAESAVSNAKATLASDQATLTGDSAALQNARQNLAREQTLLSEGLIAKKDAEAAELAVQSAQATVDAQKQTIDAQRQTIDGQIDALESARAASLSDDIKRKDVDVAEQQAANARGALATAKAQYSLYTLKAPLAGHVVAVGANLGESVDSTAKLVTIANLDQMQVQIAVPSEKATLVHPGEQVTFTVDGLPRREFQSVIHTVGSQVDPSTNAIPAYADIDNHAGLLNDDQTARVRIVLDHRDHADIVPRGAVLTDAGTGAKSVAVIGPDNVIHIKNVTVGIEQGDNVEITSGVTPGDRVAVGGQYSLPEGTKVSVQSGP